MNKNICGIYQIQISNKIYIGSSVDIRGRKSSHLSSLRRNVHRNAKLQNAFNKHGEENLIFNIVEICTSEERFVREQYWIDLLNTVDVGFNLGPADPKSSPTAETKSKIARAEKGKIVSIETRKRISKARKGVGLGIKLGPLPEETKRKIGNANRGRNHSFETKEKISQWGKGRKVTDETKEKMRVAFGKPVGMFAKTGELLRSFVSCAEVERELGFRNQAISRACIKNYIHKDYYWKYLD